MNGPCALVRWKDAWRHANRGSQAYPISHLHVVKKTSIGVIRVKYVAVVNGVSDVDALGERSYSVLDVVKLNKNITRKIERNSPGRGEKNMRRKNKKKYQNCK